MGNSYSSQKTYKICLQCNSQGKFNDKLMILNTYDYNLNSELLLRCSMGHLISYKGPDKHIEYCKNEINKKNNNQYQFDVIKEIKEIKELKKEIEKLKK